MTINESIATIASKVQGTWNLHSEIQLQYLDYFFFHSVRYLASLVNEFPMSHQCSSTQLLEYKN